MRVLTTSLAIDKALGMVTDAPTWVTLTVDGVVFTQYQHHHQCSVTGCAGGVATEFTPEPTRLVRSLRKLQYLLETKAPGKVSVYSVGEQLAFEGKGFEVGVPFQPYDEQYLSPQVVGGVNPVGGSFAWILRWLNWEEMDAIEVQTVRKRLWVTLRNPPLFAGAVLLQPVQHPVKGVLSETQHRHLKHMLWGPHDGYTVGSENMALQVQANDLSWTLFFPNYIREMTFDAVLNRGIREIQLPVDMFEGDKAWLSFEGDNVSFKKEMPRIGIKLEREPFERFLAVFDRCCQLQFASARVDKVGLLVAKVAGLYQNRKIQRYCVLVAGKARGAITSRKKLKEWICD